MKRLLVVLLAGITLSCQRNLSPEIIPMPLKTEMGFGSYVLPDMYMVALPDSSFLMLEEMIGMQISDSKFSSSVSDKGDIMVRLDETLDDGSYTISVRKRNVIINAADYSGAVAAFATLGQMISSDGSIPVSEIVDRPRLEWRGFMLDVSRHFFSKDEIKELLRLLASYKFNRFHWHLSDDQGWRIEMKSYPELTAMGAWRDHNTHPHDIACADIVEKTGDMSFALDSSKITDRGYGGYYTQEDVKEIVAYASALGVEVVPELDMPGHSLKVVESYPYLCCSGKPGWGKHFSTPLCPGNDRTLEFARTVYKEVFDLFPFRYVHLGADEVEKTHWEKCPACQARKEALGIADEAGLQAWFVSQMHEFFEANGKTLIGWDEIVDSGAPENSAVMWWRGWRPDTRTMAVKSGHDIIISSSEFLYLSGGQNRNSLMKVYDWDPVADGLDGYEDKVLGIQAHVWTEMCPSWENACGRIFPRLFAVSETAWTDPSLKDADDFERRVRTHLRTFDRKGINYRIPDISGFCDMNVFTDSVTVVIDKPFDDIVVRYTDDGTIPFSDSPVYDEPVTVSKNSVLCFRPFTSKGMPGEVYKAEYRQMDMMAPEKTGFEGLAPGLKVDWYDYRGESCDSITTVSFNASYVTEGIYIPQEVAGNIGLVFTGYINIPEDGVYSFYTYSDDGSYIRINGDMIVNNNGPHSRVERSGQAALKKGLHKIEARYFDHSGGILEAGFLMPDGSRRLFASGDFLH